MVFLSASEEEDTRDFTVRETERLKFITGRGEEEKTEEKDKNKDLSLIHI